MNKFEQVSSDDHQMSLSGVPMVMFGAGGPRSDVQGDAVGAGGGCCCTVRSNTAWVMIT